MNLREKLIKRWLKALRSGKYKQGRGQLVLQESDGKYYCCLGVVCEEARKMGIYKTDRAYRERVSLPEKISRILGLHSYSGGFMSDVRFQKMNYDRLDWLNDQGMSFKKIADLIEKKFETEDFV